MVQWANEQLAQYPKLKIVITLAVGIVIGWVDSRSTWDDAGITALAVVVTAAAAAFGGIPWWLSLTLVVGPIIAMEVWHGVGCLLAILFGLLGGLIGSMVRRRLKAIPA